MTGNAIDAFGVPDKTRIVPYIGDLVFELDLNFAKDGVMLETKGELMGMILLIILILLLVGALPTWPYSSGWGYYPSGGLGLILVILIVMLLMGRLV
jgi:hypothetical protein